MKNKTPVTSSSQPANQDKLGSKREGLSRERVIDTALSIVDRDGLAKLSMRNLGAELGVDPMAVYDYVPNKAALLDGLIDAVMTRLGAADDRMPGEDVTEWFICQFSAFWDEIKAHPNVLPVMESRPITGDSGMQSAEKVLCELRGIGLTLQESLNALTVLTTMTITFARTEEVRAVEEKDPDVRNRLSCFYQELDPAEFPLIVAGVAQAQPRDWKAIFQFALRAFIDGLITQHASNTKKPAKQS